MQNLWIIFPGVMFALQTVGLKFYSKKCKQDKSTNAFFMTLFLAITAFISIPFALSAELDPQSILFGAIFGLIFYAFIKSYSLAISEGSMTYTVFIVSMSLIIPIFGGMIFFERIPTIAFFIAILAFMVAIFFMNFSRQRNASMAFTKKWLTLCLIAFLANGLLLFISKYFQMTADTPNSQLYLAVGFLVATILSSSEYLRADVREGLVKFSLNKWFIILAFFVAIMTVLSHGSLSIIAKDFENSILYTLTNVITVLASIAFAVFLFKEKLKIQAIFGILISISGIFILYSYLIA